MGANLGGKAKRSLAGVIILPGHASGTNGGRRRALQRKKLMTAQGDPGPKRETDDVSGRRIQLLAVNALNRACTLIDVVAYRPFIVKLTERLPRWWGCQLAHLSMKLDDRWGTGYWASDDAPAAPEGLCDACRRRPAWQSSEELSTKPGKQVISNAIQFSFVVGVGQFLRRLKVSKSSIAFLPMLARSVSWRWR